MGRLKPGVNYIYERSDGIVYAREFSSPPEDRFEIGRSIETGTLFGKPIDDVAKIVDMMDAAEKNPALQNAIDKALLIYELSKEHIGGY